MSEITPSNFRCEALLSVRAGFLSDGSRYPRCTAHRMDDSRFCGRHAKVVPGSWKDWRARGAGQ